MIGLLFALMAVALLGLVIVCVVEAVGRSRRGDLVGTMLSLLTFLLPAIFALLVYAEVQP